MVIEPKVRGFICTTAHPEGCKQSVLSQIRVAKTYKKPSHDFSRALVIGGSTGYGLASRIALAFSCGASTLNVMFERPAAGVRTATAGWYNTAAFEAEAEKAGLYAKSINGDAFSAEIKKRTAEVIRRDLGKVDCVVYSLAAPRRTLPDGTTVSSVLKTIGEPFTEKTIDLRTREVGEITVPCSTQDEIDATVKVMGGEDFAAWIEFLHAEGLLAENAEAVAYSYIGPVLTHPIYLKGTIGMAKRDLYYSAEAIRKKLPVNARIAVNKALVTQSSAAIPVVPLYISLLYKTMKEKKVHEGCIEQMCRLFTQKYFTYDDEGYIRMDDLEMKEDVQKAVEKAWKAGGTDTLNKYADLDGFFDDFYKLFGFN
ncbi:MAG: trans-2-enoyl-CoA reductase family protein, partial [Clostridiales bacterium]|nr:trans-2-enoyl-CoA reductase family protein [Clostridiales bacterium]